VTLIIYNGADVSLLKSYHSLRNTNVRSTRELVRLAAPRQVPVHYLSTGGMAHLLAHDAEPLSEVLLGDFPPPVVNPHGYISTKWPSERFLEKSAEKYGIWVLMYWYYR